MSHLSNIETCDRSSTPDIPSPVAVTAQIHHNTCDKSSSLSTSKAPKSYNCTNLTIETRSKDILPLNNSLLDNIDMASDFDFSLPPSPSTSRILLPHSPSVDTSPNCSRPASKVSTPTSRNTISPAFKNYLFAPKSLDFGNKKKAKKETMPLAISSQNWRRFIKEKDDEKDKLIKQREERKKRIEMNKAEKARKRIEVTERRKKRLAKKKITNSNTCVSGLEETQSQITNTEKENTLCAGCEEELKSDVEEDALKNIGCDKCPKWFHLMCTAKKGRKYDDVAKGEFICHHCLVHLI